MKLDSSGLLQQMQQMTRQSGFSNESVQSAIQADMPGHTTTQINPASKDFGQLLSDAINHVNHLQGTTSSLRTRFDLGDKNVSLSDVMIAAQKSSIAFDATLEVRNKVVEAYKQIMSMPI